jgi:hypothetical protein
MGVQLRICIMILRLDVMLVVKRFKRDVHYCY